MDAHLDAWGQWIVTNALYYALVTFNTASRLWNLVSGSVKKSVAAILDAHREDLWIFSERNGSPWAVKYSPESLELFRNLRLFTYRPEKMLFQLVDETVVNTQGFTDVVLARLLQTESQASWDVSSFFHSIRWTTAATPSLFEIATVCLLDVGVIVGRQELLEKFVLEVMTADGEDRRLVLQLRPFSGWTPATADDAVEEELSEDESSISLEEGEIQDAPAAAVGDENAPAAAVA